MEPLSLTGKQWRVRIEGSIERFGSADATTYLIDLLRSHRGIGTDVARTLHAGMDATTFPHLPKAVDRIRQATKDNHIIAVFGDYDCDGITSTALLARYFHRRGVKPLLRLPHRLHEGYGLKSSIVREFIDAGVKLLITVDTGIAATKEIAEANAAGMDVIILDHHHPPAILPEAYAILHPAVHGIPEPHPSAAGITWSLVEFLEHDDGNAAWPDWQTDIALATIGTIADLVELKGVNRTLVQRGLEAFSTITREPLGLLRLQTGLEKGPMRSRDVAFRIAPRLNAAGRMAEPTIALHALLGDEESILALEDLNRQRQELVGDVTIGALADAASSSLPFIALKSATFTPGICGLIAGKLTEKLGKPSMVLHEQGEMCVGSLRSIADYNVTEGLRRNADLLLSFGGHAMAAGCSMPTKNFETLQTRMAEDVARTVDASALVPFVEADVEIGARHLSQRLCEALHELEPHGQGNPEPAFILRNVVLQNVRRVGRDQTHLQGQLGMHKLIGFSLGALSDAAQKPVDLVCRLGIDTWQGRNSLQLFVEDMRIAVPLSKEISSIA